MYNVYVSFPGYIPGELHYQYSVVAITPTPGDSLNRSFSLMLVRASTTDTILACGRTDFVIGKAVELDNALLGYAAPDSNGLGADTFNNCERQTLYSAINEGVDGYNNYMVHMRDSITTAFKSFITNAVTEKLLLGSRNDEFNYTLYNYDRAGNLTFTVPPAGVALLAAPLLDSVDTTRAHNTPTVAPANVYSKINNYYYDSYNKLTRQITIDGGTTNFFYDATGRLIFSQNAKQGLKGNYSYNIYDNLNRIIETGEIHLGCPYFDPIILGGVFGISVCSYYYPVPGSGGLVGGIMTLPSVLSSPHPRIVQLLDQIPIDSIPIYIRDSDRFDVVVTVYDTAAVDLGAIAGFDHQEFLRKRVSAVKYFEHLFAANVYYTDYSYATHYSYDIEGNVKTLVQDYPDLERLRQRYKRIDYDYDLISGKVNMLSYNRGWPDQFYQKYAYDPDNRLAEVRTSNDGWIWQKDADYSYYDHGPLARVKLGSLDVQGIDYAYSIQGWLKSMNGDTLQPVMDMGKDGYNVSLVARDAVAYTIDYFTNDYKPVLDSLQHTAPVSLSLYNGNISRQAVAIDTFQRLNKQYIYDQLNRIHNASYATIDPSTGALTTISDYASHYDYDADGNLQSLVRYAGNTGSGAPQMDSLIYQYSSPGNNKLAQIYDFAPYSARGDIDTFTRYSAPPRYSYDANGNVISDLVSGQDTVEWNMYNKVTHTISNSSGRQMFFEYDGAGNRVSKTTDKFTDCDTSKFRADYYVHDAQGNILAIYHENYVYFDCTLTDDRTISDNFSLAEHSIYGSSRLGTKEYYRGQIGVTLNVEEERYDDSDRLWKRSPWYSLEYQDVINPDSTNLYGNSYTGSTFGVNLVGQRQYELTDHLGDVLATISDKRATDSLQGGHTSGDIDTIVSFKPVVVSATDYYPFGMQMPGRTMVDTTNYTFNTTINEDIDYFHYMLYPFSGFYSSPTTYGGVTLVTTMSGDLQLNTTGSAIDSMEMVIDSLTPYIPQTISITTSGATTFYVMDIISDGAAINVFALNSVGTRYFTFTPLGTSVLLEIKESSPLGTTAHINLTSISLPRFDSAVLGNVVATVSNEDRYHYGFNGQMKVNEITGVGNHNTAQFWEYDTRTGRRWNVDPKPDNSISLYAPYKLNPIRYADLMGDSIFVDSRGYITRNDNTDNMVFINWNNKPIQLGEIGKVIKADFIFSNLMISNMKIAKGIYNPLTFKNLVRGKGEWDYKNNKKTIYGLANHTKGLNTLFKFGGNQYDAPDLGNIHFGAVGKAYGLFTEDFMLKQAGAAQIEAGTSKPEWQKYETKLVPGGSINSSGLKEVKEMLPPYGDDPRDQEMIKTGFKFYETQKEKK